MPVASVVSRVRARFRVMSIDTALLFYHKAWPTLEPDWMKTHVSQDGGMRHVTSISTTHTGWLSAPCRVLCRPWGVIEVDFEHGPSVTSWAQSPVLWMQLPGPGPRSCHLLTHWEPQRFLGPGETTRQQVVGWEVGIGPTTPEHSSSLLNAFLSSHPSRTRALASSNILRGPSAACLPASFEAHGQVAWRAGSGCNQVPVFESSS